MILKADELYTFFQNCQAGLGGFQEVILPRKREEEGDGFFFTRLEGDHHYILDGYRSIDPVRLLFYYPREQVTPATDGSYKRLLLGVKACDLKALQILDKALINEDFVDPNYEFWRENTYIVTSDCSDLSPSCHCNLLGGKPYPEEGFDLNLTHLDDQFMIAVGSPKGEELLQLLKENVAFYEDTPVAQSSRDKIRQQMIERLEKQNAEFAKPEKYEEMRQKNIEQWIEESKNCVGCGGCTNICPTCYCIIVNDETAEEPFVKVRSMDSCQLHGYARVAGGDTPRPKMYNRFRNRYLCKFDYMQSNFGVLGCVGCGRCTEVCAGEIEFREVVRNVLV